MERLTERNKNGLAMAACCGKACEYNYVCEVGGFGECRGMDDIIDRLADIEDILGDGYDLDRLRELLEADRDGRCVVLPCKIGYPVWRVYDDCEFPGDCGTKQKCKGCEYRNIFAEEQAFCMSMLSQNGKLGHPYYTSLEAAEAALKGEQHAANV